MGNVDEREWAFTRDGWIWIGPMENVMQSANDRVGLWMEVQNEIVRQDEKWGEQSHVDNIWLAILTEEVGELAQAILHDLFGGKAAGTARTELIHVVAVGVQWLACMDRR